MSVAASTLLGRPLWYELMTTDMSAADAFYRTVVGWTSAPFDGAPEPYSMFSRGGGVPVAGLMTKPEEVAAPSSGPCSSACRRSRTPRPTSSVSVAASCRR